MARRRRPSSLAARGAKARKAQASKKIPVMSQAQIQSRIVGDLTGVGGSKTVLYEHYAKRFVELQQEFYKSKMSDRMIEAEMKEAQQLLYAIQAGLAKEKLLEERGNNVQGNPPT